MNVVLAGTTVLLAAAAAAWQARRERRLRATAGELRRRVSELQAAERCKDEFLGVLAHELRNPLAPIRNAVYVLRRHGETGSHVAIASEVIDRQVLQLVRLIENLPNRQGRRPPTLRRERVELAIIVSGAVDACRAALEQAGQDVVVGLPRKPVILHADSLRLVLVFADLIGNAGRMSPPGSRIWITAHEDGEEVVVSVRDQGLGMAPDILAAAFMEPTGDDSEGSPAGTGLGLLMVRRVVEWHGGTVSGSSGGPGQGCEIVVRLPVLRGSTRRGAFEEVPNNETVTV